MHEAKLILAELSTISFAWMVDQVRPYLSIDPIKFGVEQAARCGLLEEVNNKLAKERDRIAADIEAYKHSTILERYTKLFKSATDAVRHPIAAYNSSSENEVNLREKSYDWGTGQIIDSYTMMYRLGNGERLRTPGESVQDPRLNDTGDTFEEIHPTVGYRMKMTEDAGETGKYCPAGQKHVQRRKNAEGAWEYTFGDKSLPEYKMLPADSEGSFERSLVFCSGATAQKYVEELDKGN